jgi:hypothetical protein
VTHAPPASLPPSAADRRGGRFVGRGPRGNWPGSLLLAGLATEPTACPGRAWVGDAGSEGRSHRRRALSGSSPRAAEASRKARRPLVPGAGPEAGSVPATSFLASPPAIPGACSARSPTNPLRENPRPFRPRLRGAIRAPRRSSSGGIIATGIQGSSTVEGPGATLPISTGANRPPGAAPRETSSARGGGPWRCETPSEFARSRRPWVRTADFGLFAFDPRSAALDLDGSANAALRGRCGGFPSRTPPRTAHRGGRFEPQVLLRSGTDPPRGRAALIPRFPGGR